MKLDNFRWLDIPAEEAARRLLGCELIRDINEQHIRVRIVETEAYDQTDEASHTFNGRSARNQAMFKSAGHLYVYSTYGMHHCCNVVCGPEGYGSGVLIRAVEPLEGLDIIETHRAMTGVSVTNGPGKICSALDIDRQLSGHDLAKSPIRLIKKPALADEQITVSKRIGISKAIHELRRFYITNNPYISKR
ncbi:MAG TPA: DNA-3-methyladenine glycosylase [Candidatus Saccharibacteria bacterium]|nr:DNA-3-methyladenine glycosylase [Candidatus Saccharibacteria bacterium]HMR38020.1 DNA-3-methyladenine glycosylase [Candidatus Saccharibacteria bacterium]